MRVAVLGAGLQGACAALELGSRGVRVDLYDRESAAVTQASVNNEGKLHLGYVYANDPTGASARIMVAGALSFAAHVRGWIGARVDRLEASAPFVYALHRESLVDAATLEAHLRRCVGFVRELHDGQPADYFGSEWREWPERLTRREVEAAYDPALVTAAFRTPEISIDPEALALEIRTCLAAEPNIRCRFGSSVTGVSLEAPRPIVRFDAGNDHHEEAYDHVVNALWASRLEIDGTAGLEPARPWTFRMKRFLRVRRVDRGLTPPSTTIVLGPFGDVTRYANGDLYLSWYPAGLAGLSSARQPPPWPVAPSDAARQALQCDIVDGLRAVVPQLAALGPQTIASSDVGGGVIFAWGASDIDDPTSFLHTRATIGPESYGRYHTVNTGKFTTAPMFAKVIADRVTGRKR